MGAADFPPLRTRPGAALPAVPSRTVATLPPPFRPSPDNLGEGAYQLDLREYLRILKKRRTLILSIVASFFVGGLLWTLLSTRVYTATVRLQIDRNPSKIVESGNIAPAENFSDLEFLKTQFELLQSRNMASRVVSMTRPDADDVDRQSATLSVLSRLRPLVGLGDKSEPTQQSRDYAATSQVLTHRIVRPIAGSRLIDVAFSDPDPERARRVAAAYGDAFIAFNLDKRFQANAYAKTFLDDQIRQLKLRLEDGEKALLDFAEKQQIIATGEKVSIAESNLANANAALGTIVSERIKNEQLSRQVQNTTAISMPQILSNKVVETLRERRNQLETDYEEKSQTFRADYPLMLQLNNKIKELDRQLANEVRTIKQMLNSAFEASLSQENEMKSRITGLRSDVLDLQKRSIQYNIVKREVDTTRSLYEGLLQRYKEVDVASGAGANNVFIIDKADLPQTPTSPSLIKNIGVALTLGLIVALGAATLVERSDDVIHVPEDAERISGLVTLGLAPRVKAGLTVDTELGKSRSALSEAYKSLCTTLQFSTDSGLPHALLVTSAGMSEGKSTTSLAIAKHFATVGMRVLLIDADMRKASLHQRMRLENSIGLSNYLTGNSTPNETIQRTEHPNLFFISAGPAPPNAADLLASGRLTQMLKVGEKVFDLIVLDGPPVLGLADVPLLTRASAGTLLVVAAGQTRLATLRIALKRLRMARAPLIGFLLNKFDARAVHDDYGYGYGYSYQQIDDARVSGKTEAPPPSRRYVADRGEVA